MAVKKEDVLAYLENANMMEVSELISDSSRPGVESIIGRVRKAGTEPSDIVDACLDVMGPLIVSETTRSELIAHASRLGEFDWSATGIERLTELMQLIVATREYQFA